MAAPALRCAILPLGNCTQVQGNDSNIYTRDAASDLSSPSREVGVGGGNPGDLAVEGGGRLQLAVRIRFYRLH